MSKKATLSHALDGLDRRASRPPVQEKTASRRPPSREGKRAIAGFFDPEVSKQLKQIALDNDASVQDLLTEALNDLFVKHGKSAIA
jgi:hypothetical protein